MSQTQPPPEATSNKPMFNPRMIALVMVVLACVGGWMSWSFVAEAKPRGQRQPPPPPCDPARAMSYLEAICEIGPRPSGSEGMVKQQAYLTEFFESLQWTVERQEFGGRHPVTGEQILFVNLVASYQPELKDRILLCAHYDTRPYPDRDRRNPKGVFVGANDGASGVATLMELAHHLPDLPQAIGVDIILFDGEELIYDEIRDPFFIGSKHFANAYASDQWPRRYRAAILLDMVGDADLEIYQEKNSVSYARDLVDSVWASAKSLKVTSFHSRARHEVRDDHLALNEIAKIPAIDIIDFDYPRPGMRQESYWHTTKDIPANCSGDSLATVGSILFHWLSNQPNANKR
jgi:glutaminyl-peptide cyclotransferase